MKKIISFSDLQKRGLKLAKIVANRQVSEINVKEKMADMRRIGAIETAKVVMATEAIKEELDLVDFDNHTIAINKNMAKNYVAILDGQNRATAHRKLSAERGEDGEATYSHELWFEFLPDDRPYSIMEYISRVNDPGHTWTLNDYAHGAGEMHKEYPTLSFISSLVSEKFPYSSAAKWASLNRRLTPYMVRQAVNSTKDVDPQFAIDVNLKDGKRLVTAARKTLDIKVVRGRTTIDWVLDMLGDKVSVDNLESFFLQISEEQASEIKDIKGVKNGPSKEMMVKEKLTEYYNTFCNNE